MIITKNSPYNQFDCLRTLKINFYVTCILIDVLEMLQEEKSSKITKFHFSILLICLNLIRSFYCVKSCAPKSQKTHVLIENGQCSS
jgi:hypothetical protein